MLTTSLQKGPKNWVSSVLKGFCHLTIFPHTRWGPPPFEMGGVEYLTLIVNIWALFGLIEASEVQPTPFLEQKKSVTESI